MSEQQHSESKTPSKSGDNSSQKPDKANEIIRKSGQDAQQRRDAHSNSASAGSGDESEDMRGGQHSSTKSLETEPDRVRQTDRNDVRSRVGK